MQNDLASNVTSEKRRNYLQWDEFVMALTLAELKRCKTEKGQAAVLVNSKRIVQSMAHGAPDDNDVFETHAVYKVLQEIGDGTILYLTNLAMCEKCFQRIIETGLSEIIYLKDRGDNSLLLERLQQKGIECREFSSQIQSLQIDFVNNSVVHTVK